MKWGRGGGGGIAGLIPSSPRLGSPAESGKLERWMGVVLYYSYLALDQEKKKRNANYAEALVMYSSVEGAKPTESGLSRCLQRRSQLDDGERHSQLAEWALEYGRTEENMGLNNEL